MKALLAGHERIALQFSGGRDSLAMLLFMRNELHRMTVYYVSSGDVYPETRSLIEAVRGLVPHFVEIAGDVHATQERHGWPSDVLPAGASWPVGQIAIANHMALNDRYQCCRETLMQPMHERMVADGITLILRGQRDTDEPKSIVRNGETTTDGFTIAYPIHDWTTQEVTAYIAQHGANVPPFYAEGAHTASDCMHCTAWLEHNSMPYLRNHHPVQAAVVDARLRQIKVTVRPYAKQLENV